MAEILKFTGFTAGDVSVENVMEGAIEADLDSIVIIGRLKDGSIYFAGSKGSLPETLWDIKQAEQIVLNIGDYADE